MVRGAHRAARLLSHPRRGTKPCWILVLVPGAAEGAGHRVEGGPQPPSSPQGLSPNPGRALSTPRVIQAALAVICF